MVLISMQSILSIESVTDCSGKLHQHFSNMEHLEAYQKRWKDKGELIQLIYDL